MGWREWVALPELGVDAIKVKVDTGARTSALHAFGLRVAEEDGQEIVRFSVHPVQRSRRGTIEVAAPLHSHRWVRSSNGERTLRPTIVTRVVWDGREWPIELTLTNRDEMGFRMLLGREAVRRRVVVDPGRSYLGGGGPDAAEAPVAR
jgi:hypothetical protein